MTTRLVAESDLHLVARLCLVFVTVFLAVRLFLQRRPPRLLTPPGPRGLPFLGFLPFLDKDFHLTLTRLSYKFGPVYQIFLGGKRVVVLNDARIVRQAFRQPVFSGRPDTELTKILQGYGNQLLPSDPCLTLPSVQALSTQRELCGRSSALFCTQSCVTWEPKV